MTPAVSLEELGFNTLAGQPASSRDLVQEVAEGESLGFGTVFISERSIARRPWPLRRGRGGCRCYS